MKTWQRTRRLIGMAILCSVFASHLRAENRTWKDATGDFTLEAEFVEINDGKVKLKKADGTTIEVSISKLSSDDQTYVEARGSGETNGAAENVSLNGLTGKPQELANDDGKASGKKSFPRGIASAFQATSRDQYLTGLKIHGSRYGASRAAKEDFEVTLCDVDFKPVAEFKFPYSTFQRTGAKWITLRVKPTKVHKDFVLCLNFNPTGTKGVFISHDAEGKSLVGLPNKSAGQFTGGDWMIRAVPPISSSDGRFHRPMVVCIALKVVA